MTRKFIFSLSILLGATLAACASVPQPTVNYDPTTLRFDGQKAFEVETNFVTQFPYRHSGAPNNKLAAEFMFDQFTSLGLTCEMQEWQEVNYSVLTDFRNVACKLPGESPKEILITAHFDQSPDTVQGADNDGSGIAILLQLAEILASEATPRYTLAFVATDGEEYGMLGSAHYVRTHPNPENILAGFSNDNLGREYYDAMNMELIGQYRKYGPIWLPLTLRAAADAAPDLWQVNLRSPLDQIEDQIAPISFMDQGPMVAAGIPALGLAAHVPAESAQLHFDLWHRPDDNMDHQTAESLGQSGRIAEAFMRQLLTLDEFPRSDGPYIYFDSSHQILRGLPLYLIFIGFVAIFLLASVRLLPRGWSAMVASRRRALPHLLSLWLPLLAGVLLTYVMVAVGLMDKYAAYPATSKDAHIYNPRWPAIIIFLVGLAFFFWLGRKLAAKYAKTKPEFRDVKSLALGVIGIAGVYVLLINPFSLLFIVPCLFWLLIAGRKGAGKAVDIMLFILGGLVFYGLFYFFGFVIYDYNFNFAWFLLMMFSVRMIGPLTAIAITAIIGAGLSLVVGAARKNEF